jgi:hypothetical protein
MGKCVIFVHAQAFFEGSAALPVDLKKKRRAGENNLLPHERPFATSLIIINVA